MSTKLQGQLTWVLILACVVHMIALLLNAQLLLSAALDLASALLALVVIAAVSLRDRRAYERGQ